MTAVPRPRSARFGLGTFLALAFSLLSILLTLLLTLETDRNASERVRSSIGTGLAELAQQTASRMDRAMFERYREVELIARRIATEPDMAAVQRELDAMQASYPYYAWIGLADSAGRVQASTGAILRGDDVSQRPWFSRAQRGQHLGDVHEALMLARLLDNPGKEPLRFVDVAFPLRDAQGRITGVLGAHLSWQWALDLRDAIFVARERSRTLQPLIVAADGKVLLGPPGLEGTQLGLDRLASGVASPAGYRIERWADGRSYLVGYSKSSGYRSSPGLGWTVLVRQELGEAEEPVRQLRFRLLAWGVGTALLFSVLGWFSARAIVEPLLKLMRGAQMLESGESTGIVPSRAYKEVEALGESLNSLVGNLQQKEADLRALNATLERRVEQRTGELGEALARARESQQRIATLIETAPHPFVGMDFEGRVTDWNSQAEKLFGWRRDEVLGRPLATTVLPPRYAASHLDGLERFTATGLAPFVGRSIERTVITRDGREVPVEVKVGLIDTGTLRLFSAFVQDISARKEMEQLKNEFISTVSHELRTPMTAVYASLSLLESGMAGELPADAQQLVAISSKSCERLIRLINDVLDVEKIQSGLMQYDMRRQPLQALVEQAISDTSAFAREHGVQIEFEPSNSPMVQADADRIVQVTVNLVSNAAKFSPPGGAVQVRLAAADGVARVSVTDHGAGVPASFRERVFERFAQADGSDRRQKGGTGLGLNICRSIVQAHRGRIDFSSEPGRTEFLFELPLA